MEKFFVSLTLCVVLFYLNDTATGYLANNRQQQLIDKAHRCFRPKKYEDPLSHTNANLSTDSNIL